MTTNDQATGELLGCFMFLGMAGAWIGSGFLAWEFVEPDSFWTVLLFLLVWAIVGRIAYAVFGAIIAGLAELFS